MTTIDPRDVLARAARTRDDLEARLLVAAAAQLVAERCGIRAVVTGGTAVDFYAAGAAGTSSAYPLLWKASADIDVIALAVDDLPGNAAALREALARELGAKLQPLGRDADGAVVHGQAVTFENVPYAIDVMSQDFLGTTGKIWTVEIADARVHLRGPEDTVVAYAESGWRYRDGREWERALAVYRAMKPQIDEDYLSARAATRGLTDTIAAVREQKALKV